MIILLGAGLAVSRYSMHPGRRVRKGLRSRCQREITQPPSEGYRATTAAIDEAIALIDGLPKTRRNPRGFRTIVRDARQSPGHLHAMTVSVCRWEMSR